MFFTNAFNPIQEPRIIPGAYCPMGYNHTVKMSADLVTPQWGESLLKNVTITTPFLETPMVSALDFTPVYEIPCSSARERLPKLLPKPSLAANFLQNIPVENVQLQQTYKTLLSEYTSVKVVRHIIWDYAPYLETCSEALIRARQQTYTFLLEEDKKHFNANMGLVMQQIRCIYTATLAARSTLWSSPVPTNCHNLSQVYQTNDRVWRSAYDTAAALAEKTNLNTKQEKQEFLASQIGFFGKPLSFLQKRAVKKELENYPGI